MNTSEEAVTPNQPEATEIKKPEPTFPVPYTLLLDFEGGYLTYGQLVEELHRYAGTTE